MKNELNRIALEEKNKRMQERLRVELEWKEYQSLQKSNENKSIEQQEIVSRQLESILESKRKT